MPVYSDLPEQTKKARIKASAAYAKKHTIGFSLQLNTATDTDVIDKLDSVPNKAGYIKSLIRADIAKEKDNAQE